MAMVMAVLGVCLVSGAASPGYDAGAVYDEVCRVVPERFYDPELNGVDWDRACGARRERALDARTPAELGAVVNELLGELETSHTSFLPKGSRRWAELMDVFFDDEPWAWWPEGFVDLPVSHVGIGVVTREVDGRVFALDVYPGTPAAHAGIVVGDEIVSVAGERWHDEMAWAGEAGERVTVQIRRERGGAVRALEIAAAALRPDDVFVGAQRESLTTREVDGVTVAYVRMRNGGGDLYADLMDEQLRSDEVRGADALVLDIRGGWGGVPLDFVSKFDREVSRFEARLRGGEWVETQPGWRKALVVLMDGGSRSGKEVFAHNVKAAGIGTLVGERTMGAVVGGTPIPMPDGSVLYLAVMDVRVDGARIEGVGVQPDVEVGFDLPYAAGADPRLEAAFREAARRAEG